jgi:hypothetical protein
VQKSPEATAVLDYTCQLEDERKEVLAVWLYVTVNRMTIKPEHRLSLPNARLWVDTYDEKIVRHALWLLKQRSSISKPAGFIKTVLRSTATVLF